MKRITTVLLLVVGLVIAGCAQKPQESSTSSTHVVEEPRASTTSSTLSSGTTTRESSNTTNRRSTSIRIGGSNQGIEPLSPEASSTWLTNNGYYIKRNSEGGYSIIHKSNPNLIQLDITGKMASINDGSIGAVVSIDENGKLRVAPHR